MAAPSISYWQRTVPDFPLSTDLPSAVDTAVIGGGLLGASTCYWLAKAGVRVALLERTAIAAGATGRNGGVFFRRPPGSFTCAQRRPCPQNARYVLGPPCQRPGLFRRGRRGKEDGHEDRE